MKFQKGRPARLPGWGTGLILLGLAFAAQPSLADPDYLQGEVERISDGDTITFRPATRSLFALPRDLLNPASWDREARALKVRMVGMDAPEHHLPVKDKGVVEQYPWGRLSTKYLERIIQPGDTVTLASHGTDRYGRVLGTVYKGKHDVNLIMVRAGYAVPYVICEGKACNKDFFRIHRVRDYLIACDQARRERRGVFDEKNPMREMPFEFRLRMMKRRPDKYTGDFNTRKLYGLKEYRKVDLCRRVHFYSKSDAARAGFKP